MCSTIIRIVVLIFALIGASHANADFEAGQSAWDAGNMDEALSHWRDGADAGERRAMLELGRLYRQGLGVVQDYIEAHKWLNLAASRGEAAALEERDALAAQMTPEQLATAQRLAAAWQPGEANKQSEQTSPAQDTGQPPPQAIRAAQSLLAALGYQPGPADDNWTSSTKSAYQEFLRDAGLPQEEVLSPQSLRAIQAAAEQQGIEPTGDEKTTAETTQSPVLPAANTPPPVSPDALHNAAQTGDIEVLTATLAAGVNVNARDSRGRTALMRAVDKGYLLLVSALLEAQADINVRAPDGATALFMAAAHGHTEIIELLMKAGADVSIRGPQGKTPTEVATTRYGDAYSARQNGEPPAVLALLTGRMWAEEEVERKQIEARIREPVRADEMVSIPAGTFRMGDRKGNDNEKPIRRVTVPAFKLGKYEVTFSQWDACVTDGGCNGYFPHDGGYADDDGSGKPYYGESWGRGNRPVINVSWDDVQSFISWLNRKTGGNYRLPSEAEWEYAARAGTTTKYSWGDDIGSNRANCSECGDSYEYTAPVGSFPANAWGLHDMHGNAEEWLQDCWNDSYKRAPKDGSAWTSGDCSQRVMRNGAWIASPTNVRSAARHSHDRWNRASDQGFRLAQDE